MEQRQRPLQTLASRKIGSIESIAPSAIRVSIDPDAPQGVLFADGTPLRFPRINGFVLMPVEGAAVVGLIQSLAIERSPFPKRPGLKDYGLIDLPYPTRIMGVAPLGVLRSERRSPAESELRMERGVQSLPTVGDPVFVPTESELRAIIETSSTGPRIQIGRSPLAREAGVFVNPDRLFARHFAVLGNTGSGKSCSVAGILRWSIEEARRLLPAGVDDVNGRFLILDPNGEYTRSFNDLGNVAVFRVEAGTGEEALRVPAWLWNGQEWAAFSSASPGVQRPVLQRALRDMRAGRTLDDPPSARLMRVARGYLRQIEEAFSSGPTAYQNFPASKNFGEKCKRLVEDLEAYQSDLAGDASISRALTDAHDDILGVVSAREWSSASSSGFNDFSEADVRSIQTSLTDLLRVLPAAGEPSASSEDAPLRFDVDELASHIELIAQGESNQVVQFTSGMALRIRTMLGDPRMASVTASTADPESLLAWLNSYLGASLDDMPRVSVIDLSLVPSEILHVVAAVMARVVFESLQRYKRMHGVELPTVLVLEEAHHFIHRDTTVDLGSPTPLTLCRAVFERVAREGRKFGLGLVLSSQRPSELSPTVLSQCNTFLLHRTVNDRDQQLIRHLMPDNVAGLIEELPSLPTSHAILVGLAASIPLLVEMRHLEKDHRPTSGDPHFWRVWSGNLQRPVDWGPIAEHWESAP